MALDSLPSEFAAGTTVAYTRTLADYPASDGWALTLYVIAADVVIKAAVADGDSHAVTLSAADTKAIAAGTYRYVERVALAGEVFEVGSGFVTVTPDPTDATADDYKSQDEKLLEAIDAVLAGRITTDVEAYSIEGRALTRIPVRELARLRATVAARVSMRRRGSILSTGARVSFPSVGGES